MKLDDLKKIYYTKKEIAKLQQELESCRQSLSGMQKEDTNDLYNDYKEDVEAVELELQSSLRMLQKERKETEEMLMDIKDPEVRLIARLRVVNNLSWKEIGQQLNMDRTTASRKFYSLFEDCTQCTCHMC